MINKFILAATFLMIQISSFMGKKTNVLGELDKTVQVQDVTQLKGYNLELVCTGPQVVEKVMWYKDRQLMVPAVVKKQTKGRVLVKPEHRIVEFSSARPADSGLYTCVMSNGTQVGHFEVTVAAVTSLFEERSPIAWMFWTTVASTVVFILVSSIVYCKK